ncbi:MAG: ABC transporter ATP-binding protein [Anaerolineae bacterium]|nr:ABC transporter ATP-binding protein [Anaerolineae bacterium]
MIETSGLTRRFDGFTAVDHVDLSVKRGEVFGFLGPNGAGKTTTIRMLAALIGISEGEAWVAGFKVGEQDQEIRKRIGILTESPGLYDRISVEANLRFFARMHLLDREQEDRQVDKYLSLLGLQGKRKDPAATLSKGMKQKLALARAMLHEPEVLFLDEPTSGLDPEAARVVREFMAELGKGGRTIILCTHNLFEADLLCSRIGIIKQRLLRVDTPAGLRASLYGQKVEVELSEPAPGIEKVVKSLPFVTSVQSDHGTMVVELQDPDRNNPVMVSRMVEAGAQIRYVRPVEHSLEDAYLALVAEGQQ